LAGSDDKNNCDDLTGGSGPRDPSDATRRWLDNVLAPSATGAQHTSDPIARNPKDVGKPGEVVQATDVYRRGSVPAPGAGITLLPADPSWGLHQRTEAAPSATDLLVSILRFKWTILIVGILVSAPIIAGVWTQVVPQYQARAEIRVRPIIPRLVFRTEDNGMIPLYDSFVNTQISVIRSQTVLQRVLDQPEIQKTKWYKDPAKSLLERLHGGNPTPALERLRDGLSARPRPRTEIIDVSFVDPSANDAKLIVDTVLKQYMEYNGKQSTDAEDELYRKLVDQYDSLQKQIQGGEKTYTDLCAQLGTDTPQALVSAKRLRLDEAEARLKELRRRIKVLTSDVNQVSAVDSNGVQSTPVAGAGQQPRYYEDVEWRKLNTDVKRMEQQIADSVYLPTHPAGIRMRKELNFAKGLLQERQTQLDELWRDHLKNAAVSSFIAADANGAGTRREQLPPERELARTEEEEKLLSGEFLAQQVQFKEIFERAQLLEKENRDLRQKRELFDAVRQRKEQKDIERNVPGSIEVNAQAYSPSRPEKDRRVVFTIMGLFAGLGVGGGLASLRAMRNQTIYALKDMPQPAQAPFLGYMPLVSLRKPLGEALCEEIGQKQVLLIESVRVLRTALLSRLNGQGSTTVLVTSANEGTGKSSFTTMLGKSIAQAGRKVLMIDADLHKMGLSLRLKVTDKPGFRESLKDKTAESLHVFPTGTAGLDIMPGGQQSDGDIVFEEISNGAFKNCISRLFERHGYDIILLDGPPILPVADAAILAGQVDATILVEREHVSRRVEVANALIRLGSAGGRLLGTVFVGSAEYSHYGYGSSYGHYGNKTRES
jgi:polysaccharide biosynthesis transport protein